MIKDLLFYSDNNDNKTVYFKRMDGRSFCFTVKSTVADPDGYKKTGSRGTTALFDEIAGIYKLKELESKLHSETELRNQFGLFYITTILIFFIISCIPNTSAYPPGFQIAWTWTGLLLFIPPVLFLVKKIGMSQADLGISACNLKKNIKEGLLFSFLITVIMLIIRFLMIRHGEIFFSWKSLETFSRLQFYLYVCTYPFHCYLQEFVARGVLQGLTQRFFSENHFMFPVFLVSFLFCAAHIRISLLFGGLTFIISTLFGYIYYRHKNLLGVSIVHFITGLLALALGYF